MIIRLYALALRCYPARFRRRFSAELMFAFRAGYTAAAERGVAAAIWFGLAGTWDAIACGLAERRNPRWRAERGESWTAALRADASFACRLMIRSPRVSVLVIGIFALGIGLTVSLFSAAHALLVRPLPYGQESRVVVLWETSAQSPRKSALTPANVLDLQARLTAFEHVGALAPYSATVSTASDAVRLQGRRATASSFQALGVAPFLGRLFAQDDEVPGRRIAIVSHDAWLRVFGGDPSVIGRTVLMNELPRTVVGVLRPGFRLPGGNDDVFIPFVFSAQERLARKSHFVRVVARLREGTSLAEAQANAAAVAEGLAREYPDANRGESVLVEPIREALVGDVRPVLRVLVGAVTVVLLIACVNGAHLLLARALQRGRELEVRLAIGAGRGRLVRQLLVESLALVSLAAAVGLLLAVVALTWATRFVPPELLGGAVLTLDTRVALLATAACGAVAAAFGGLVPALAVARRHGIAGASNRTTDGRAALTLRHGLVVMQVALALVLLTAATLLAQSFARLSRVDPGFRAEQVLTFRMELPRSRYAGPPQWQPFFERLTGELRALPGVTAAAGITSVPLNEDGGSNAIFIEGRPHPPANENTYAIYRLVTPGAFETLGVPVLEGRDFGGQDGIDGLRVAAVNSLFATRFWPGQSAIGKRFAFSRTPGPRDWITIVSVVGNTHHSRLDAPVDLQIYAPYTQDPFWFPPVEIAIRTSGDPLSLAATVRERIRAIDPLLPVNDLQPLTAVVDKAVAAPRFYAVLVSGMSLSALALAVAGLYAVLSFSVAARARELGIRSALGATSRQLARLVTVQGLALAVCGIGLGVAGAFFVTRALESLLFATEPRDPLTFAAAGGATLTIAAVTCYLPARRAAHADPVRALRNE